MYECEHCERQLMQGQTCYCLEEDPDEAYERQLELDLPDALREQAC